MTSATYSYDTIFAFVQSELNRGDFGTEDIDRFIRLAEKRLYRKLRIPANQKKVTGAVALPDWSPKLDDGVTDNPNYAPYDASGFFLPPDYLEGFLMTDGSGNYVERISEQEFRKLSRTQSAFPSFWTIEAGQVYFYPSFNGDFFFIYYYEPDPISSTNQSNPVTEVIGEAISYMAVSEGWRFIRDPEKQMYYAEIAGSIFKEVTDQWNRSQTSGGSNVSRNPYGS